MSTRINSYAASHPWTPPYRRGWSGTQAVALHSFSESAASAQNNLPRILWRSSRGTRTSAANAASSFVLATRGPSSEGAQLRNAALAWKGLLEGDGTFWKKGKSAWILFEIETAYMCGEVYWCQRRVLDACHRKNDCRSSRFLALKLEMKIVNFEDGKFLEKISRIRTNMKRNYDMYSYLRVTNEPHT